MIMTVSGYISGKGVPSAQVLSLPPLLVPPHTPPTTCITTPFFLCKSAFGFGDTWPFNAPNHKFNSSHVLLDHLMEMVCCQRQQSPSSLNTLYWYDLFHNCFCFSTFIFAPSWPRLCAFAAVPSRTPCSLRKKVSTHHSPPLSS